MLRTLQKRRTHRHFQGWMRRFCPAEDVCRTTSRGLLQLIACVWFGLLAGCTSFTPAPTTPAALTPAPTPTPLRDTGWQQLIPGLEERWLPRTDGSGASVDYLYLVRLDPAHFRFDVAYAPGAPQTLAEWRRERAATVVVNAGYFTADFIATGVVIQDGTVTGTSYDSFAGMVTVDADGELALRWLADAPWSAAEPLHAGFQSFPMLIKPGAVAGFTEETGRYGRRAAIGRDDAGRIVLLATRGASFTLHELSNFLVASDLALDIALNLDGGTSAGLLVHRCPPAVADTATATATATAAASAAAVAAASSDCTLNGINGMTAVPTVLLAWPR